MQSLALAPINIKSIELHVSNILLKLGILPNLRGFTYLKDAIIINSKNYEKGNTSELYTLVASKHETSVETVERNCRSAIQGAFKSGTLTKINELLAVDVMDEGYSLTNSQFISLVGQFVYFNYFAL